MKQYSLGKNTKLCNVKAIDSLFDRSCGQNISAISFPLRAVWRVKESNDCSIDTTACNDNTRATSFKFLISVPKKRLRHAVDRVTMRRRVREAIRLHRHDFDSKFNGREIEIIFLYISNHLQPYRRVEQAVTALLSDI